MRFEATKRQKEMLEVVKRMIAANGYAPSNEEIAAELGVTAGCVSQTLKRLARRGYVMRLKGAQRSLTVCDGGRETAA